MCSKLIYAISFVLVLSLVGYVQAQDISWTDKTGDHNWFTEANWNLGVLPTNTGITSIGSSPGPIIGYNEGAVAYAGRVYISNGGVLTMDGGTLLVNTWFNIAQSQTGTLNMYRGTLQTVSNLSVANAGQAKLNMTGGTINIGGTLQIPEKATATGDAKLHGGIMTANNIAMRPAAGGVGTIDMGAGTLIINGNQLAKIQGYIDADWISAYEGHGTLHLDYNVTNAGKTTLTATHSLNPNPADGSTVPVSVNQLQWTLPEPNQPGGVVTADVYFGTDPVVDANPKVVLRKALESVSVTLAVNTTYYWAFDVYDSSISNTEPSYLSPIFTFTVGSQAAPVVDAGKDIVTWLDQGQRVGNLAATVIDDGPLPCTVTWTVVTQPDSAGGSAAVIANPSAANTTVTLIAVGEYVLQAAAFDGELTGSDTVTIKVYKDSCEAARSLPDYVPLVGDLNSDCKVDDADLALLNASWLQANPLTDDWFEVK